MPVTCSPTMHSPTMHSPTMPNATLVATFLPNEPIRNIDYRSELEEIERERETREIRRLMCQRYSFAG